MTRDNACHIALHVTLSASPSSAGHVRFSGDPLHSAGILSDPYRWVGGHTRSVSCCSRGAAVNSAVSRQNKSISEQLVPLDLAECHTHARAESKCAWHARGAYTCVRWPGPICRRARRHVLRHEDVRFARVTVADRFCQSQGSQQAATRGG